MRERCKVAFWLALLLALHSCGDEQGPTSPSTGSVQGVLTEIESDAPVPDVRVSLWEPATLRAGPLSTPTDATGSYRVDQVAPGDYVPVIYHKNMVIFGRTGSLLHVRAGQVVRHDLRLQASGLWTGAGARINGTVLDADTGMPVPGAHVGITGWALQGVDVEAPFFGTTLPEIGVTDGLGRFTLITTPDPFGPENYLPPFSVTKFGYKPYTMVGRGPEYVPGLPAFGTMIPAPLDSLLNVEIRLHPDPLGTGLGVVRGRVVFAGQPVPGLPVGLSLAAVAAPDTFSPTVRKAGEDGIETPLPDRTALSDASGAFEIAAVPFGTYVVISAYLANDGYRALARDEDRPVVTLTSSTPVDAGDLRLAKALQPLHPPDGSLSAEPNPEIRWEPLTDLPEGYTLVDYRLNIDDDYALDFIVHTREPRWQVPVRIRPNAHIRWLVQARVVQSGSADTLNLGVSERAATFTVASPVTVTVSPGTSPTFSWTPSEAGSWLSVEALDDGADQWVVTSDSTNVIVPPVHYGDVPEGARELRAPVALTTGTTYLLLLVRNADSGGFEYLAIHRFTP